MKHPDRLRPAPAGDGGSPSPSPSPAPAAVASAPVLAPAATPVSATTADAPAPTATPVAVCRFSVVLPLELMPTLRASGVPLKLLSAPRRCGRLSRRIGRVLNFAILSGE